MIREGLEGLLCDLDGVVYRGNDPVPGVAEAIGRLRERGVRIVFCTNNSRYTVEQYVDKLNRFGIQAGPRDVLSSAVVTGETLGERGFAGARAIVVGGDGVRAALRNAGIEVDDDPKSTSADLVVVGWDPHFDYAAMRRAALAVGDGALLIATNDDAAYPAPDGKLWPGAGALLASIERATGMHAEVMGKPHTPMMDAAARRFGSLRRIAVAGDRPDTDLAGGAARGWGTILVLSGVTRPSDADRARPRPDLVVDSLAGFVEPVPS